MTWLPVIFYLLTDILSAVLSRVARYAFNRVADHLNDHPTKSVQVLMTDCG